MNNPNGGVVLKPDTPNHQGFKNPFKWIKRVKKLLGSDYVKDVVVDE